MNCEGGCKPCWGSVGLYEVQGFGKEWGTFWYCRAAVDIDLAAGFDVRPISILCDSCGPGEYQGPDYPDNFDDCKSAWDVQRKYPRISTTCQGCGCGLIYYSSAEHYIAGDW